MTQQQKYNLWNDYAPTDSEIDLNISRILDRIPQNFKYIQFSCKSNQPHL